MGSSTEPRVVVDPPLTAELQERLVDMWVRVTNAGGSVGFVAPVTREHVRPVAARSFEGVRKGRDILVCLADGEYEPDAEHVLRDGETVMAWLLLARSESGLRQHWRTVYHVQVDPEYQGGGLGTRLMGEAAIVARDQLRLQALRLMTRSGTGAERFYKRCGYREVGRIPGAIRITPDDDRDEVHFWLDLT